MTDPIERADLLPHNGRRRELAIHDADAAIEDLDTDLIRRVGGPDIAEVPANYLPQRAWARSVDVWDPTWPEATQRAVTVAAPAVHRRKGTRAAVTTALAALGVDNTLTEWWEASPRREPYTFSILAFAHAPGGGFAVLDGRTIRNVFASVLRAKPLSRAFDLHVRGEAASALGMAPVLVPRCRIALAAVAVLPDGVTY